jgi:hypothetical protein
MGYPGQILNYPQDSVKAMNIGWMSAVFPDTPAPAEQRQQEHLMYSVW